MTLDEIQSIIEKVSYLPGWDFRVMTKGDGFLLQVNFEGPDSSTGKVELQKCRKWYVSSYACEGEVVRTALKAIEAAEDHERCERFRYKGVALFNPHLCPSELANATRWMDLSIRKET